MNRTPLYLLQTDSYALTELRCSYGHLCDALDECLSDLDKGELLMVQQQLGRILTRNGLSTGLTDAQGQPLTRLFKADTHGGSGGTYSLREQLAYWLHRANLLPGLDQQILRDCRDLLINPSSSEPLLRNAICVVQQTITITAHASPV